jgi:2,3-diketo-5-methylthiopentyl-1-phosphate enolase
MVQSDSNNPPPPYYDPIIFHNILDGIDRKRCLMATYYVEDRVPGEDFLDHFALIQSLALEGSTGTWEKVEEETPEVRARLSGKLVGYYEIPSPEPDTKRAVIQLAFPMDAWEPNVPMMLLSIAGNCFAYSPRMRLLDVAIPDDLLATFQGPRFGVPGIREMMGIPHRPLSLHIIKPKMGMTPESTAKQVYQTCLGGVDMIKDDEMCSDVYNCRFEDRLKAVLEAIDQASQKTGKRPIYFVSITDEIDRIVPKALKAMELGATGLLLTYSAGLSALRVLTSHRDMRVPVLLHASHMIAAQPRISWPVFAKLCRLCGADLMLTPTYWSSIPMVSLEEGIRTAQVKLAPWQHIKPTWPMPCAGVYPGLTEILVKEYGTDIVIPAGGGMLGHPMGYTAGAEAWQQAIEVVMSGRSLKEAAGDYPELKAAVEKWGIPERPRTHWLRADPRFHPKTTR